MATLTIPSWRPDLLSLLIGVAVGLILAVAFHKKLSIYFSERLVGILGWSKAQNDWLGNGAERRFRAEMAKYVQSFHLGSRYTTLEQIFVEPRLLVPQTVDETGGLSPAEVSRLYYLWPDLAARVGIPPSPSVSIRQLLLQGKRVALTGEAGVGKTTLLAYLAYLSASKSGGSKSAGEGESILNTRLPIFVHIAGLDLTFSRVTDDEPDPEVDPLLPLLENLQQRFSVLSRRSLTNLIQGKAKEGQLLLLLDGCDELSNSDRLEVADWLKHLLFSYPNTQVVMASSIRGCGPLIDIGFTISVILPWRIGQAEKQGEFWKTATGSIKRFEVGDYWRPSQTAIETTQRLHLVLYPENSDLSAPPERRPEMFEGIMRQILFRIAREPDGAWLAPAVSELWQTMAYQMMVQRVLYLTEKELTALAGSILNDYISNSGPKAISHLIKTVVGSELIVTYGGEHFAFLSPVWRDFLASSYLVQAGSHSRVVDHFEDPYWEGTLRFYIGQAGGQKLALKLLNQGSAATQEHLFLLASWLPEAKDKLTWRRPVLVGLGRLAMNQNVPVVWRQRAALALAATGETGVGALLNRLLEQSDASIRQVMPAALAMVNDDKAVLVMDRLLDDSNDGVRAAVAHAIAWSDDPSSENALVESLLEPDEPLSWAAAEGLALNGTLESYEILREAITDQAFSVRRAAVEGLALLDVSWSIDLLKTASLKDEQRLVQQAATEALQNMNGHTENPKWRAPQAGDQAWLIRWAVAQGRMVPVGAEAIPFLLEALKDNDPSIRVEASLTLGQLANREAKEPLQNALEDPEADVRTAAFTALCELDQAWDSRGSFLEASSVQSFFLQTN